MGNKSSSTEPDGDVTTTTVASTDPSGIEKSYNSAIIKGLFSGVEIHDSVGVKEKSLLEAKLKELFGAQYGSIVSKYLWPHDVETITLSDLSIQIGTLLQFDQSVDETYVSMFQNDQGTLETDDLLIFMQACCAACGLSEWSDSYTTQLQTVFSSGLSPKMICSSIESNCPRLLVPLKNKTQKSLTSIQAYLISFDCPQSSILSPFRMALLQLALPVIYISRQERTSEEISYNQHHMKSYTTSWRLLYSSDNDGLSVTRFDHKVMGYVSPTVMIVRLTGSEPTLFAIGIDEGWRPNSIQSWGGHSSIVMRMEPKFQFCACGPSLIYFNTKSRASPMGIQIGSDKKNLWVSIDGQFSNVVSMEVWGCGSETAHKSQQDLKEWERKQVEKQLKVPLPGKWDENPDKELLLMAGVKMGCNQGGVGSA